MPGLFRRPGEEVAVLRSCFCPWATTLSRSRESASLCFPEGGAPSLQPPARPLTKIVALPNRPMGLSRAPETPGFARGAAVIARADGDGRLRRFSRSRSGGMRTLLPTSRRELLALAAGAAVSMTMATAPDAWAAPLEVAAVYNVPVEQQWVSRIHKALNAAQERGEITYVYSENVASTDYERVMREYADAGKQLIMGEAFSVERAARQVAEDYPDVAFLMGSSFGPAGDNFAVFDNWIHEPSYLTGMVAGRVTESNLIGMVGGYPIPEVNRLMHAFMDGAREVDPDVEILATFIGSWYDPPKAKEAAFAMIDAGADIL